MSHPKEKRGLPLGKLKKLRGRIKRAAKDNLNALLDSVDEFEKRGGLSSIIDANFPGGPTASGRIVIAGSDEKSLRQYHANLEVEYGADMATVKKSYRALLRRYHPDKHSDDPEREKLATELTQQLTRAYEAISDWHRRRGTYR